MAGAQQAPPTPHPLEGRDDCTPCHGAGSPVPMPADHEGRTTDTCTMCHAAAPETIPDAEPSAPVAPAEPSGEGQKAPPSADDACLACHGAGNLAVVLPSGESLPLVVDPEAYGASVHGRAGVPCTACHEGYGPGPHERLRASDRREYALDEYDRCRRCHGAQYSRLEDSVHSAARAWGNRSAPVCTDCHGAHTVTEPDRPRARISRTCGLCHSTIVEQYRDSVHGAALYDEANGDVPSCSDCHGVHDIHDPRTAEFRLRSPELCARCHADPARMGRYGLTADVYDTYVADFHGTTVELFERLSPDAPSNKAVCYDCHGVHDIRKVNDPDSHVIKENLVVTCRRCHPNADVSFIGAWVGHYRPSPDRHPLVYYIRLFYTIAIPAILGFMILMVLLDAQRRLRRRRAAGKRHPPAAGDRRIPRFSATDRVEHWLMVASFTMLAATGLPQMFSENVASQWVIWFFGGIEMVRTLHHLFAVMLVLETVFHLVTVVYKIVVRRARLAMLPRWQDVKDFLHWTRWTLGARAEPPTFDRYGFEQKIEYWALIWGTVVMIVTGFILLVPIRATSVLPGEIVPAAKTAHGYEAILAVLAVIVWHFYGVHVRRWNRAMTSGSLGEEEMREEHGRELERLETDGPGPGPDDPAVRRRRRAFLPFAVAFLIAAVVGVKILLTEETSLSTVPVVQISPFAPATPVSPASEDRETSPEDESPATPDPDEEAE